MPKQFQNNWTPQEDNIVDMLLKIHGFQWKLISDILYNRTPAMVRNRYLRRNIHKKSTVFKNFCKTCGKFRKGHTCYLSELNIVSNPIILNTDNMANAALLFSINK